MNAEVTQLPVVASVEQGRRNPDRLQTPDDFIAGFKELQERNAIVRQHIEAKRNQLDDYFVKTINGSLSSSSEKIEIQIRSLNGVKTRVSNSFNDFSKENLLRRYLSPYNEAEDGVKRMENNITVNEIRLMRQSEEKQRTSISAGDRLKNLLARFGGRGSTNRE